MHTVRTVRKTWKKNIIKWEIYKLFGDAVCLLDIQCVHCWHHFRLFWFRLRSCRVVVVTEIHPFLSSQSDHDEYTFSDLFSVSLYSIRGLYIGGIYRSKMSRWDSNIDYFDMLIVAIVVLANCHEFHEYFRRSIAAIGRYRSSNHQLQERSMSTPQTNESGHWNATGTRSWCETVDDTCWSCRIGFATSIYWCRWHECMQQHLQRRWHTKNEMSTESRWTVFVQKCIRCVAHLSVDTRFNGTLGATRTKRQRFGLLWVAGQNNELEEDEEDAGEIWISNDCSGTSN